MKNKGITLIALVITIIIMLILVAVTVSYTVKSELIGKTMEARAKYEEETIHEEIVALTEMSNDGEIDVVSTYSKIEKKYNVKLVEHNNPSEITTSAKIEIKGKYGTYAYIITQKEIEKIEPEVPNDFELYFGAFRYQWDGNIHLTVTPYHKDPSDVLKKAKFDSCNEAIIFLANMEGMEAEEFTIAMYNDIYGEDGELTNLKEVKTALEISEENNDLAVILSKIMDVTQEELKEMIEEEALIPVTNHKLIMNGKDITDKVTWDEQYNCEAEFNLEDGDNGEYTFELILDGKKSTKKYEVNVSWMAEIGDYSYYYDDRDGITSIQNLTEEGKLKDRITIMPDKVEYKGKEYYVEQIISSAFYNCKNLALTSLPSRMKWIGDSSFYGCTNLALTSLPNSIIYMGKNSFFACDKITSLSVPWSSLEASDRNTYAPWGLDSNVIHWSN